MPEAVLYVSWRMCAAPWHDPAAASPAAAPAAALGQRAQPRSLQPSRPSRMRACPSATQQASQLSRKI
eukprot:14157563-Alexandrium_andersonii.AAC.1